MNNLYGLAMIDYLPKGEFQWDSAPTSWTEQDILNWPEDADFSIFAEVDLEYPKELHDIHQHFPMAPVIEVPPNGENRKLLNSY